MAGSGKCVAVAVAVQVWVGGWGGDSLAASEQFKFDRQLLVCLVAWWAAFAVTQGCQDGGRTGNDPLQGPGSYQPVLSQRVLQRIVPCPQNTIWQQQQKLLFA